MKNALHNPFDFIKQNTIIETPSLVPEIPLYLATEITPIWQASESFLEQTGIEPPFWAFAWPGSQLIARFMLDNPHYVQNKRIWDIACGCGLAGIAAAKSNASYVLANDIDPMAITASQINADLNQIQLETTINNLIGTKPDCDLLVIGDVCYNKEMADTIIPWLLECSQYCDVWLCDPGRHYAPKLELKILAQDHVPTTLELESQLSRKTTLFSLSNKTTPQT
ncbi:class I SAM-dependent methyltransferase [Swingsia samuiensis]|uniref:Methyltransferase n=1 Tax=Swingsia samuiensis TaxID=1293412 RepID=A0A4Y6UNK9_9PROT|nr:50S ribosomal protein L11 methyltransferase [Swingsia samuiensis]QDH17645.1 methyltransferase [Swingsia samuiensis]